MATDKNTMGKLPRDIKDKVLVRPVGGSEAYENLIAYITLCRQKEQVPTQTPASSDSQ
jgi:hypothetical protein